MVSRFSASPLSEKRASRNQRTLAAFLLSQAPLPLLLAKMNPVVKQLAAGIWPRFLPNLVDANCAVQAQAQQANNNLIFGHGVLVMASSSRIAHAYSVR